MEKERGTWKFTRSGVPLDASCISELYGPDKRFNAPNNLLVDCFEKPEEDENKNDVLGEHLKKNIDDELPSQRMTHYEYRNLLRKIEKWENIIIRFESELDLQKEIQETRNKTIMKTLEAIRVVMCEFKKDQGVTKEALNLLTKKVEEFKKPCEEKSEVIADLKKLNFQMQVYEGVLNKLVAETNKYLHNLFFRLELVEKERAPQVEVEIVRPKKEEKEEESDAPKDKKVEIVRPKVEKTQIEEDSEKATLIKNLD